MLHIHLFYYFPIFKHLVMHHGSSGLVKPGFIAGKLWTNMKSVQSKLETAKYYLSTIKYYINLLC